MLSFTSSLTALQSASLESVKAYTSGTAVAAPTVTVSSHVGPAGTATFKIPVGAPFGGVQIGDPLGGGGNVYGPVPGFVGPAYPLFQPLGPSYFPPIQPDFSQIQKEIDKAARTAEEREALKRLVNEMSEENQIKFVLLNPKLIDLIDNPSMAVKAAIAFKEL